MAVRLDDDASLGGELRSARWFAAEGAASDWTDLHLSRASARLGAVDWRATYPAVPGARAWAGAAVLVVAALLVTYRAPVSEAVLERAGLGQDADPRPLTDEEREEVDALLAKMDVLQLSPEEARRLAELSEKLANSDLAQNGELADLARRLQELAEKAAQQGRLGGEGQKDQPGDPKVADNIDDLRDALDKLKSQMANGEPVDEAAEGGRGAPQSSSSSAENAASAAEASMKLVREPASEMGRGQAMLGGGAMGGDSGPGRGGQGQGPGRGRGALITPEMLRQELVEAAADADPANIPQEDLRRKTEQGASALSFTRVTPRGDYDRSRTAPPPPVPDAHRAWLQRYFVRK
jgi:hypothetical protein